MKITKKLLTLALAALMLLSLAVPVMADDSDFVIEEDSLGSKKLTKYQGSGGDVVIPDGVERIDYQAFKDCGSITSITIPSSVRWIGGMAFYNCTGLTSVTIPSNVVELGGDAFSFCTGLKSVTILSSNIRLSESPFSSCTGLTDLYYAGTQEQWTAIEKDISRMAPIFDKGANVTVHYNSTGPDTPVPSTPAPSQTESAMPTNDQLTVNGALQSPTVYKIDGSNYFKIRDLAAMLSGSEKQFDVGYDGALASVTLTTGKGYAKQSGDMAGAATGGNQTANPSNDTIYINGQKIDVTVYKIGGSNYFKLRDLGKALGFYVGWTAKDGVFIDTSKPYSD